MSRHKINDFESLQRIYLYCGNRSTKSKLLDDLCTTYGFHRKYAIRLLRRLDRPGRVKRRGRKQKYEPERLLEPLKQLWLATDQMCGKRLKAAIPLWLPFYVKANGSLDPIVEEQLLVISAATIDRLLKPARKIIGRRRRCGTKPGTLLKNKIEIKTDNWDVTEPGFMEADTVAHCGNSLTGDFAWSLTLTDIYSEWTEVRATWNKGAAGVLNAIKDIESSLPFILRGFDCDNGSEFLNHHLVTYLQKRKQPVKFTRSRPYHKDDNAHVEQRNWTHVRQLLGYGRFDNSQLVEMMNDLYCNEWSQLNNFFCPSMKLIEKTKINSKYRRKYSKPMTPYQRLTESVHISEAQKTKLKVQFDQLDPFLLRMQIQKKLKKIFQFVTPATKPKTKI